jgi:hypothetical protein
VSITFIIYKYAHLEGEYQAMIKRNIKKRLDSEFHELTINLENNYKDLAIQALKKLQLSVEELHESGDLKDKDYKKVKDRVDDYAKRMEGYHH